MKIAAFITVRTTSTRLPQKCLFPFGEGNVIQHVIRRAKFFDLEPIVCTTIEPEDDILEKIAQEEEVKCFRGSVDHKLKRWRDACQKFEVKAFHTIDADDPFFDGELAVRSYSLLKQGYDAVYPCETTYMGSVGFSLTSDIIERTCNITTSQDTEMMWYYLEKVTDLKKVALQVEDAQPIKARLTLDYDEDYWLLSSVQRILGNNATRQEIETFFSRNPDYYKINWFLNDEWKRRQQAKKV